MTLELNDRIDAARRINYEVLGNGLHVLHGHVHPRYDWAGSWCGGEHLTRRGAAAVAEGTGHDMPGFGGDRSARGVLERQWDVHLLLAGLQQGRAGNHGDADGDQQADDGPGGKWL